MSELTSKEKSICPWYLIVVVGGIALGLLPAGLIWAAVLLGGL